MNVLSLFDGISGCRLALDKLGITPKKYYASEIDKYAIQIAQHNYPGTEQLGSVTEWSNWDIEWSSIDLVTGGFPCQAWSVAGKQMGDKDPRGMLFWTMLDIMKKVLSANPKVKFLMENVKMKKEFEQYITYHTQEALGHVNKILINSALMSAQNRNRWYWHNIDSIEQPEDKGLVLADIIEGGYVDRDNAYCIDSNYHKGGNLKSYFEDSRRQLVFERPCEPREYSKYSMLHHAADATDIKGNESIKRVYAETGKAPTLTTMQGGHREPKILQKSRGFNKGGIKVINGKTPAISSCSWQNNNHLTYDEGLTYRKLTPLECERLQTLPDNYTLVLDENGKQLVSNSQRYKAIGNGWTIDVICHILKSLKE